jgi:hypothetical protein
VLQEILLLKILFKILRNIARHQKNQIAKEALSKLAESLKYQITHLNKSKNNPQARFKVKVTKVEKAKLT